MTEPRLTVSEVARRLLDRPTAAAKQTATVGWYDGPGKSKGEVTMVQRDEETDEAWLDRLDVAYGRLQEKHRTNCGEA